MTKLFLGLTSFLLTFGISGLVFMIFFYGFMSDVDWDEWESKIVNARNSRRAILFLALLTVFALAAKMFLWSYTDQWPSCH